MFAVLYDDAGGIYDHVVPPHEGVPADESPCNVGNPPEAGYSNDAPHPDGARLLNDEERQLRNLDNLEYMSQYLNEDHIHTKDSLKAA